MVKAEQTRRINDSVSMSSQQVKCRYCKAEFIVEITLEKATPLTIDELKKMENKPAP